MTNGAQSPGGEHPHPQQYAGPVPPPWAAPTVPSGMPAHPLPSPPRGGGRRTAVVAVCAAAAVVAAAGIAAFLVFGGGDGEKPAVGPTPADSLAPSDAPAEAAGPLVSGWKTVVNAKRDIAFDVPVEWAPKPTTWVSYVADDSDPDEMPLVGFSAPAILKEKWCLSDEDRDGTKEETALAAAGSRGESGARSTGEAARENARLWVYGNYAQPHKDKVTTGPAEPFTTESGLTGSVATATSSGVEVKDRCDFDGTATAFAFKDAKGEIVSWTFVGVRGVPGEVPDPTVRKILSTVRLVEKAS
ncbi:hypothetical protein GTY67_31895 [Streptomyces sp. SID8374]|uniref:hypothetical protein n=1 Tax=Streptomyces sp. SID8374 TaxID=2690354 RepID=UPI001367D650|nr:hypothetical protein [Streptomyces sp. SID8374]MYX17951.1 hypothetical protein [Streptomyces sp. SID8374]